MSEVDPLSAREREALERRIPAFNEDSTTVAQALVDAFTMKHALLRLAPAPVSVPKVCDFLETWRREPVMCSDECADELEAALNRLLKDVRFTPRSPELLATISEFLGVR